MAIIRQRRQQAIAAIYGQAALTYALLGIIVIATSYLPGMLTEQQVAQTTQLERASPILFLLIATLVIWRAYRKLSILLMLASLYEAAVQIFDGLGTHFEVRAEANLPALGKLVDVEVVKSFVLKELASDTPFFRTFSMAGRDDIVLSKALSSFPIPEVLTSRLEGLVIDPAYVSFFNGALLLIVTLMLWRAVRHPK